MFLVALKASRGLYAETARFISRVYGINYTRQSVRERVNRRFKKHIEEIRQTSLDKAERTLLDLMGPNVPDRVRLQAATFYLRKQGKERGYADGLDINLNETITVQVKDEEIPMWIQDDITKGKKTG